MADSFTLGDLASGAASTSGSIEPPDLLASIGRGMVDFGEPFKQTYLNVIDPAQAAAYRQQLEAEEALYQRGLQANPMATQGGYDMWRTIGRGAFLAPLLAPLIPSSMMAMTPEAIASWMLTSNSYDALDALRRRLGLFPDFFR